MEEYISCLCLVLLLLLLLTVYQLKKTSWCPSNIGDGVVKWLVSLSCTSLGAVELESRTLLAGHGSLHKLLKMNLFNKLIESLILIELSSSLFVLLLSYSAYHG
jgi:hypothetical protein